MTAAVPRPAAFTVAVLLLLAAMSSGARAAVTVTSSLIMSGPCYADPTSDSCTTFQRSTEDWTSDLEVLCAAMPYMIGCSMWSQCKSGQAKNESAYCSLPSLVGDVCVADSMARMKGCEAYNSLCVAGTKVEQCLVPGLALSVLTTFGTKADIDCICLSHSMDGCQECSSTGRTNFAKCPDPLYIIGKLCVSMPDMPECANWKSMCSSADFASAFTMICTGDAADGSRKAQPPMKMWFHQGTRDMFLFKEWVPNNTGDYIGLCIAMAALAVFTQFLKAIRLRVELYWSAQQRKKCYCDGPDMSASGSESSIKEKNINEPAVRNSCCGSNGAVAQAPPELEPEVPTSQKVPTWRRQGALTCGGMQLITRDQAIRNFWRACFTFIVMFLDYALMLVVMTFNVGIILAVCGGFAIGALLFGHVGETASKPVKPSMPGASGALTRSSSAELETVFVEGAACCSGGSGCGGGGHAGGQL